MSDARRAGARVLMLGSLPLSAPWNGADKNIARAIVLLDAATQYVVQTGPHDAWPANVVAHRRRQPGSMPGRAEQARGALFLSAAGRRVDLVHLVASVRSGDRRAAALVRGWSRLTRRPVVHTAPGVGAEVDPALFPGAVTVAFSEFTAARLSRAGVRDVVAMFPPVDPADWRTDPDGQAVRAGLGLGARAVAYPGHLDAGHGIDVAIDALAGLPADLADVSLVVAARGRPGQDVEAELGSLRERARAAGVADRVVLTGHVPDMLALLAACEVTLLVPRSLDGKMDLPLVVLESLAVERPVIVTDAPPISEALLGGGRAVPYGRPDALRDALVELLRDEALRRSLARVGRAELLARADPAAAAERYRDLYRRVRSGAHRSTATPSGPR